MAEAKEIANPDMENLKRIITEILDKEFAAQGHRMTNSLIEGIEYQTEYVGKNLEIRVLMANYGVILEKGISARDIPYDPSVRTGAGSSKYIQGLISYAKQRMGARSERSAKSIAFAIAAKHKKEGMPTRGSYAFSKTGKRTEWIDDAFKKNDAILMEAIQRLGTGAVTVSFDLIISKYQRELSKA